MIRNTVAGGSASASRRFTKRESPYEKSWSLQSLTTVLRRSHRVWFWSKGGDFWLGFKRRLPARDP